MVDINEIYKSNSDYLKAEDIGNQFWTVTIVNADVKQFDGKNGQESKIVLSFQETEKTMPLNITNARSIADIYGHNSNAWIGQPIMLFTMPVKYQDKMVQAVRIRAPQQMGQPPAQRQYQPGAMQPQANTRPGFQAQSPQRPLNQPAGPREFAPVQELDDDIPF